MIFTSFQIRLIKRVLLLLPIYSLVRLGFFLSQKDLYQSFPSSEILISFLYGLRFDFAALALLNVPLLLLSFIPIINSRYQLVERLLFVLLNGAGIITSTNDYELFNFTGKRLSLDFFLIADDILTQLPQIFLYYWHYSIGGCVLLFFFYILDKFLFPLKKHSFKYSTHVVSPLILASLFFVAIRGGLQSKSINVQSAFVQGSNELGQLVLNTPYHFIRTLKNNRIQRPRFIGNSEVKLLDTTETKLDKKSNIVLIILESFSLEYMEQGYTPFLSELSKKSSFFDKHLANGRKSIDALPSLLCAMPSLLSEPFSKSTFSANKFDCFPDVLKAAGMTNYFFHAGGKGTMGFESFVLSHGVDKYFSREDYPNQNDFDGTWGIYDGPYLQYVADEISNMPSPFFAGVFTLSSHQPYAIPKEYLNVFPKGNLEIHESVGYADWALKEFFKKIENEKWFKDTMFIITSDHTSKHETAKFNNMIGQYRVPLLIYTPGEKLDLNTDRVTQHSDIPKTILNYLGLSSTAMMPMGVSLLDKNELGAFNFVGSNRYVLVQNHDVYSYFTDGTISKSRYDWKTGELSSNAPDEAILLRSYLQYFFNSLINNSLGSK